MNYFFTPYNQRISKIIIMFLFICIFTDSLYGQNERITYYQKYEGLPTELTKAVASDTLGYIWVATDEGLICYNGESFTVYKDQLPSPYVKGILRRRNGQLIATTDEGVIEIKSTTQGATFVTLLKGSTLKDSSSLWFPKQLYEDSNGVLWFSDNYAIFRYDGQQFHRYFYGDKNTTYNWQRSFSFAQDAKGRLWAFAWTGFAYCYNPKQDAFVEMSFAKPLGDVQHAASMPDGNILLATGTGIYALQISDEGNIADARLLDKSFIASFLIPQSNDNILVATWERGLHRLTYANNKWTMSQIKEYKYNVVSFLYQSDADNIWVAGDNGLALVQPKQFNALFQSVSQRYILQTSLLSGNRVVFCDGNKAFIVHEQNNTFNLQQLPDFQQAEVLQIQFRNKETLYGDQLGMITMIDSAGTRSKIDLSGNGRSIFCMVQDKMGSIWIAQDFAKSLVRLMPDNTLRYYDANKGFTSQAISMTINKRTGQLFVGCNQDTGYLYTYDAKKDRFRNLSVKPAFDRPRELMIWDMTVAPHNDTLWLASSYGLLYYTNDTVIRTDLGTMTTDAVKALTIDSAGVFWFANSQGVVRYDRQNTFVFDEVHGLPSKTIAFRGLLIDKKNRLWVGSVSGMAVMPKNEALQQTSTPYFTRSESSGKPISGNENRFNDATFLRFYVFSPSYPTRYVSYRYRVKGSTDSSWKALEKTEVFLSDMQTGSYTLEVCARQSGNYTWSKPAVYSFSIFKVWYRNVWAWVFIVIGVVVLFFILLRVQLWRIKREKAELEAIVRQRTAQIREQKEDIEYKNTVLEQQKEEMQQQAEYLADANTEILRQKERVERMYQQTQESINYASRIQSAVLPNKQVVNEFFLHHFLFWRPRDVVSGDFYWLRTIQNADKTLQIVIVADCTGHGVPGSLVSMLAISLLNEMAVNSQIMESNEPAAYVLDYMREKVKIALHQSGQADEQKDGMDMGVCVVDKANLQLDFAGANSPLYIVRKQDIMPIDDTNRCKAHQKNDLYLYHIKADTMPIGIHLRESSFTNRAINMLPDDTLYFFSDGILDQTNGQGGRKFTSRNFKELLLDIAPLPLQEQGVIVQQTFDQWKGAAEQVDDVVVLGWRL